MYTVKDRKLLPKKKIRAPCHHHDVIAICSHDVSVTTHKTRTIIVTQANGLEATITSNKNYVDTLNMGLILVCTINVKLFYMCICFFLFKFFSIKCVFKLPKYINNHIYLLM